VVSAGANPEPSPIVAPAGADRGKVGPVGGRWRAVREFAHPIKRVLPDAMRPRPLHIVVAAVGVALALLGSAVFSGDGLSRLQRLESEEQTLRAEVDAQRSDNTRVMAEIEQLRGDTPTSQLVLEKRAREDLGYLAPGEVVLHVDAGVAAGAR
jgi:cell division protein FtsB